MTGVDLVALVSEPVTAENQTPGHRCAACGAVAIPAPQPCPEFIDDGRTRRCARCGWWRTTHA